MNTIGFVDTLTNKKVNCGNWAKATLAAMKLSNSHNDWARWLVFCNDQYLDYPEQDESPVEYRARMIDMAIGLQLI